MSIYDRLRDNQMPLGVNRANLPPDEPVRRNAPPQVFTGVESLVPENFNVGDIPTTLNPTIFGIVPGQTIDLGGGLGAVKLPDIDLTGVQDVLNDLIPQGIVPTQQDLELMGQDLMDMTIDAEDDGYDPDTGEGTEEDQEEDVADEEEVAADEEEVVEIPEDEAPVMPDIDGDDEDEEVEVVLTPAPPPPPPPPPATDVVTGEEIPLITPVVDVPQDSLTGLGSFFTAPEIEQIVNPPVQGSYPTDMNKLLQMQSSFLNFLGGNNVVPGVTPIGEPTDGTTGYMGEGYVPGETYQPITFGNPYGTSGTGYNYASYQQPLSSTYTQPTSYGYFPTMQNPYQDLLERLQGLDTSSLYGNIVFPDFTGITSLVPYDARQEII